MNMKKLFSKAVSSLCCVALVAALLPAVPVAAADTFFEDDFSNYTVGDFKPQAKAHGFTMITAAASPAVSVAAEGGNQFMQITAARPYIRTNAPSGTYTLRFDVKRDAASSGLFEVWVADLVSDAAQNIRFRVHENGAVGFLESKGSKNFFAQNDGGFSAGGYNDNRKDSTNVLLDADKWYTVEITVNHSAGFELKVAEQGKTSGSLFSGTATLPETQPRANIQFDGQDFGGATIAVSIDNIKVTADKAPAAPVTPAPGDGAVTVKKFFEDDFSDFTVGDFKPQAKSHGYNMITAAAAPAASIAAVGGNQFLQITAARPYIRLDAPSGTYTLSFDVKRDANSSGLLEVWVADLVSDAAQNIRFRVHENGAVGFIESKGSKNFFAQNDGGFSAGGYNDNRKDSTNVLLDADKWYTVEITVNHSAGFELKVAEQGKTSGSLFSGTATLPETQPRANIQFDGQDFGGAAIAVSIDNIKVMAEQKASSGGAAAGTASEVLSMDYQNRTGGDRIGSDDNFSVSGYENGGVITREIRTIGGNKYMQMTAWNTKTSTSAPRVQIKTKEMVDGTFTVEWDYNNVSSGRGQYFETYLRHGGNIRVRIDANGYTRIRVLAAVAVEGVMEDDVSDVALKTNNWYTFKAVVSDDQIVLEIFDKDNGNALVDTLSVGQDDSKYDKLFTAYNIWFDLWGKQDVNDQTPAAVAVDNFRLYRGTYEGTKNSQIQTPAAVAVSDTELSEGAVMVKCASGLEYCPAEDMLDIGKYAWYHKAVDYALTNKLMGGYNFYTFGPYDTLTRAQVVQVLYNKEGQPAVSGTHGFTDVPADQWFNNAITWGTQKKIMGGYGDGKFGPNDAVTIEQIAVILWQYAGKPEFKAGADSVGDHSGWAANGLAWCVENGILNGMPYDAVTEPANRAQTAQMLMNYLNR